LNLIPADESRFFIWFFDQYTRWSLKRRFKQIWVKQEYRPGPKSRTVYFLNHNLWWDGLIPLYLNRTFFHQQARALMEDKQMRQYTFFSKIGAFSINLEDPKASISSLRYAVESMNRESASLFIYPEGSITAPSESAPNFKDGLAWIYKKTDDIDFVPIHIYSHFMRSSKPELYLSIGKSVVHDKSLSRNELTKLFEADMKHLNSQTREVAGTSDEGFEAQF
jgi:1-acyl-sn-glycerol-3-phosphate acyltransferase